MAGGLLAHPRLVRALVKTNLSIALESRYTRREISPLEEEEDISLLSLERISHEIRGVLARARAREKKRER